VTLPSASTPGAAAGHGAAAEPIVEVTAPRRILAVDDDHDAADSLGMLLEMLGADCHVAYDGASALETAARARPASTTIG
jgi:PleD family two-component response regulator